MNISILIFHYFSTNLGATKLGHLPFYIHCSVLLDFSLTVKAATLIFISGCGSTISSAKEGKYNW